MSEPWRVVKMETHDAFTNMAIDEVISGEVAKAIPPQLFAFTDGSRLPFLLGIFRV